MRYMELGSSGIQVSKMGLGTWAIGGGPAWSGGPSEQNAVDTIIEAAHQGINMQPDGGFSHTAPGRTDGKGFIGRSGYLCGLPFQR